MILAQKLIGTFHFFWEGFCLQFIAVLPDNFFLIIFVLKKENSNCIFSPNLDWKTTIMIGLKVTRNKKKISSVVQYQVSTVGIFKIRNENV